MNRYLLDRTSKLHFIFFCFILVDFLLTFLVFPTSFTFAQGNTNPGEQPEVKTTTNVFGDSLTCDPTEGLVEDCIVIIGDNLYNNQEAEVRLGESGDLAILDFGPLGSSLIIPFPNPMPVDGSYLLLVRTKFGEDTFEHTIGAVGPGCTISGTIVSCEDGTSSNVQGPQGPKGDKGDKGDEGDPAILLGKGSSNSEAFTQDGHIYRVIDEESASDFKEKFPDDPFFRARALCADKNDVYMAGYCDEDRTTLTAIKISDGPTGIATTDFHSEHHCIYEFPDPLIGRATAYVYCLKVPNQ